MLKLKLSFTIKFISLLVVPFHILLLDQLAFGDTRIPSGKSDAPPLRQERDENLQEIEDQRSQLREEWRAKLERDRAASDQRVREWEALSPEERERRQEYRRVAEKYRLEARAEMERMSGFPPAERHRQMQERIRRMEERNAHMESLRSAPQAEEQGSPDFDEQDSPDPAQRAMVGEQPDAYIDRWQFRSMITFGGKLDFSLHNPWDDVSFWGGEGERRHEIRVLHFDRDENLLTIEHNGEQRRLSLAAGDSAALADAAAPSHFEVLQNMDKVRRNFAGLASTWQTAAPGSARLREIETEYDEIRRELDELHQELRSYSYDEIRNAEEEVQARRELAFLRTELFSRAGRMTKLLVQELSDDPAFRNENLRAGPELTAFMLFGREEE